MERREEDYELAAEIIDIVLKNTGMHKLPHEDGKSPTYYLGLEDGETLPSIAELLAKHRSAEFTRSFLMPLLLGWRGKCND